MSKQKILAKKADTYYFLLTSFVLSIFISFGILFLIPNNLTGMPLLISSLFFIEIIIMGFTAYLLASKKISINVKYRIGIAFGAEIVTAFLLVLPISPEAWLAKGTPIIAAEYTGFISAFLGTIFTLEKIVYKKKQKSDFLMLFLFFLLMLVNLLLLNSLYF